MAVAGKTPGGKTPGKTMSKSEIANAIVEKTGLTRKQVMSVFDAQAELAYKQAKNVFLIPGIGKLRLKETKAGERMMTIGPNKGTIQKVAAKKKLVFRPVKAAKDAIVGAPKAKK